MPEQMDQLFRDQLQEEVERSLREHVHLENVHIIDVSQDRNAYYFTPKDAVLHMLHRPEATLTLPLASDISATCNITRVHI